MNDVQTALAYLVYEHLSLDPLPVADFPSTSRLAGVYLFPIDQRYRVAVDDQV